MTGGEFTVLYTTIICGNVGGVEDDGGFSSSSSSFVPLHCSSQSDPPWESKGNFYYAQ